MEFEVGDMVEIRPETLQGFDEEKRLNGLVVEVKDPALYPHAPFRVSFPAASSTLTMCLPASCLRMVRAGSGHRAAD